MWHFFHFHERVWRRNENVSVIFPARVKKDWFRGELFIYSDNNFSKAFSPFGGCASATCNRSAVHVLQEQPERICPTVNPRNAAYGQKTHE